MIMETKQVLVIELWLEMQGPCGWLLLAQTGGDISSVKSVLGETLKPSLPLFMISANYLAQVRVVI